MNLEYRDNLLFTSIRLSYHGKIIEIDNIVVDTGASFCILEPSALEALDLHVTIDDEIETFYGVNGIYNYIKRKADSIILDDSIINNLDFYVGTVDENINGLLGLDILIKSSAIIDLNNMNIIYKK